MTRPERALYYLAVATTLVGSTVLMGLALLAHAGLLPWA